MNDPEPFKSKRIYRFVEEYAKDRNGAQAAIRAGYAVPSAYSTASALLSNPKIREMVEAEQARVTKEARIEAADILREYLALATADPSAIMYVRRVNCRYCHGINHGYQWRAREYAEACDKENRAAEKAIRAPAFIECAGGFDYAHNREPCPECPECRGEGHAELFFRDTESLTGAERKLIAGIKKTKDGLEVKMRDQDAALKVLAQYAGLLIDRKEISCDAFAPPEMIVICGPDE